jgi:hypothetical protein
MLDVLNLTIDSKINYCKKHNYSFMMKTSWEYSANYHFKSYINEKLGYDKPMHGILGFLRVTAAFELLKEYDNVMWIDGDSIITNDDYKIEDFFINEKSCLFVSHDWHTREQFSTGNFIVRRNQYTNDLFNTFLEVSKHFIGNICQEQATLNYIYNNTALRESIAMLDHAYLNSVPKCVEKTETWKGRGSPTIINPWTPKSFLAHLTGTTNEERIDILKQGIKLLDTA